MTKNGPSMMHEQDIVFISQVTITRAHQRDREELNSPNPLTSII